MKCAAAHLIYTQVDLAGLRGVALLETEVRK